MSGEISKADKLQSIGRQGKDQLLMDSMIDRYQASTKSAVENILNMCVAVSEISARHKSKQINDFDMMYFCSKVGLEKNSSTFRKYRQIGDHAPRFVPHMKDLPSAYTVLFQITTLDPDKFEGMIANGKITPSLSLEELKRLTNTTEKTANPDNVNFKVEFNSKEISKESQEMLCTMLEKLSALKDVELLVPGRHQSYLSYWRRLADNRDKRQ